MTRRLSLAILLTVLISVLLAGIGTFLLTRHEDRQATRHDLERTADALAFMLAELPLTASADADILRARLQRIQEELRLADAELLVLGGDGRVFGEIPDTLEDAQIDLERLRSDGRISGTDGPIVYAAALGERRAFSFVVILTEDSSRVTGPVFRWIVLSTLAAVAAGGLIAWMLGRRLARPVTAASEASRRIAGGDLSARVPVDQVDHDEIGELSAAINDMAASLERSRDLERHFLLSVSHDLRTPLTSIRGYAEAIADGTAPDQARAAEVIGAEAGRLERLVTDLLDLARLDARQFDLRIRPTDLSELVPDVAAGFEHQARVDGVAIAVDGADRPVLVHADPDRLAQVVANLVENALKYADRQVQVTYGESAAGGEIVVADDGLGIATDDLPRVFERLYVAARPPTRRETGSGLGLAIVKELVDAHGGSVTALPRPTGGTQVVVTLPGAS